MWRNQTQPVIGKPDGCTVSSSPVHDGTALAEFVSSKLWCDGVKLPIWFLIWGLLAAPAVADHSVSVNVHGFVAFKHIDSDHNSYVRRVEARSVEAVFESTALSLDDLLSRTEHMSVRSAIEANGY